MKVREVAFCSLGTAAAASGVYSYLSFRRFRRRLVQSALIRNTTENEEDTYESGAFVKLEGEAGAKTPLKTPKNGQDCVRWEQVTLRVVDQQTEERTRTTTGRLGGLLSFVGLWPLRYIAGLVSHSDSTKRESWAMQEDVVAKNEAASELLVYRRGDGRDLPPIRVDCTGAEFFELQVTHEAFQPAGGEAVTGTSKAPMSRAYSNAKSTRTLLGYKTIERALLLDKPVLVFGEVSVVGGSKTRGGGEGATDGGHVNAAASGADAVPRERAGGSDILIHKPRPNSIFDLKTSQINRPFVVTTMSEAALLDEIERSGRWQLWWGAASLGLTCVLVAGCLHVYVGGQEGSAKVAK